MFKHSLSHAAENKWLNMQAWTKNKTKLTETDSFNK